MCGKREIKGRELITYIDRESVSGKTLNQYLQNRDMKYPDEAIHLIFAANRWEMRDQILSDLKSGITLICDRYAFSGVAYSAAKVGILVAFLTLTGSRL
jgi:dTMP kinase